MDIESLRFTIADKKGRRFSVNMTASTVNYRDLGGSRTGVAVTEAQAEAIDAARKKIEAVLKGLSLPAAKASAAPGKPSGALTRAQAPSEGRKPSRPGSHAVAGRKKAVTAPKKKKKAAR